MAGSRPLKLVEELFSLTDDKAKKFFLSTVWENTIFLKDFNPILCIFCVCFFKKHSLKANTF